MNNYWTMKKQELIKYLDEYLNIWNYKDDSKNGLQVDLEKDEIKKIGFAVDATTYIFDKAIDEWVDMILSHHGIYWGFEQVLTWVPYKRAKLLIDNNIWLYACHLPLDAHPEVWNNIWLLKAFVNIFGLRKWDYEIETFWDYHWETIWFWLKLNNELHISNIVTPYSEQMQLIKRLYNFWNKTNIKSICFVSWGGWNAIQEAHDKWYDVFLTWELAHYQTTFAKELWLWILEWWHYETEKIWPKLLAHHLQEKFGLDIVYLDEKY